MSKQRAYLHINELNKLYSSQCTLQYNFLKLIMDLMWYQHIHIITIIIIIISQGVSSFLHILLKNFPLNSSELACPSNKQEKAPNKSL